MKDKASDHVTRMSDISIVYSTGNSGISGHSGKSSNFLLSVTPTLQLLQPASQPLYLCFEVIDDAILLLDTSRLSNSEYSKAVREVDDIAIGRYNQAQKHGNSLKL